MSVKPGPLFGDNMAVERELSEFRLRFATDASEIWRVALFAQSRVKNFRVAENGLDVRFGSSTGGSSLAATGCRWYGEKVAIPWAKQGHWGVKSLVNEFVDGDSDLDVTLARTGSRPQWKWGIASSWSALDISIV